MNQQKLGYVEIEFGPTWRYVNIVQHFVEEFLSLSLDEYEKAEGVVVAVGEVVGNAIKYSVVGKANLGIEVYRSYVMLHTKNSASPENIQRLEQELQKANQGSPLEAYMERLQYTMSNPREMVSLGLARVRYEANAELDCRTTGNQVELLVKCFITKKEKSNLLSDKENLV